MQYRGLPTYTQPLTEAEHTSSAWYRWTHDTEYGTQPAAESVIKVGASPFTYQATRRGFLIVNGGSVSAIQFTRVGTYTTGQTAGTFPMNLADQVTVTYASVPILTFVPT